MKQSEIASLSAIIAAAIAATLANFGEDKGKVAKTAKTAKTPLGILANTLPVSEHQRADSASRFFNPLKNLIDVNLRSGVSLMQVARQIEKKSHPYRNLDTLYQSLRNFQLRRLS